MVFPHPNRPRANTPARAGILAAFRFPKRCRTPGGGGVPAGREVPARRGGRGPGLWCSFQPVSVRGQEAWECQRPGTTPPPSRANRLKPAIQQCLTACPNAVATFKVRKVAFDTLNKGSVTRGPMCTFQTCTLFSARIFGLNCLTPPFHAFRPPLLCIASLLNELKWAITSPKKGQALQRYHEEPSAHSKCACLSPH